jgi:hypothetical protein
MHKIFSKFIGVTAALTLTVAACGDDITGINEGDTLSNAEVAAVVAALSASFDSVGVAAGVPAAAPGLAPISFNESFGITVPCEDGTLDVDGSASGTIDDETFASDISMEVTWDPNGCVVTDGTNTITVDGAPRIELTLDWTSAEDVFTFTGTEVGGFSFTSSDGRSGSCALDVTFSLTSDVGGFTGTVSGTICGLSAEGFQTIGVPDAV